MTAVADLSPLILLGKVRRLDLLHTPYGDVVLPPAVVDEVLAKPEAIGPDLRAFVTAARVGSCKTSRWPGHFAWIPARVKPRRSQLRPKSTMRF